MSVAIENLYHQVEDSDGLDRLVPVEAILDEAETHGGLQALPENRNKFYNHPGLIVRLKKRLFHLGYLKQDRETPELSPTETEAIKHFQKDAGITIDGWVGRETWQVLEDLFSFEADSHIGRWTGNEKYLPLLKRAVQLRLFAFGLLEVPPHKKRIDPMKGLQAFVQLATQLGITDQRLNADYTRETLHLLFDQNRISRRLANASDKVDLHRFTRCKSFVVCNAKVELWLLGYPIVPDGKGTYRKPPRHRHRSKGRRSPYKYTTFHRALTLFCQDANAGDDTRLDPRQFEEQYTAFFREFAESHEEMTEKVSSADLDLVVSTIHAHPDSAQAEWSNQQSFAGRLWDGIKRAWGWLKRLIRKAVRAVTTLIRNALRVVWSLAVNAVGIVKAAIRSFPGAVQYFLRSELEGSRRDTVVFTHDPDFDWRIYVAPGASPDRVYEAISQLREQVVRFTFSTRLVGMLLQALLRSVRLVSTGFLAVFLAISRMRPALEPFLAYYHLNRAILMAEQTPRQPRHAI